jgi:hypothetical protein
MSLVIGTAVELFAMVNSVDRWKRGEPTRFQVYAVESRKTYTCVYHQYYPIRPNDHIYALCRVIGEEELEITAPPFVQIPEDKSNIVSFLAKVFYRKQATPMHASAVYDRIEQLVGKEQVGPFLSERAKQWAHRKSPSLLECSPLSPPEMKTLLVAWYKQRHIRRLDLLGLRPSVVRDCRIPPDELYSICIDNPFRVAAIPMDKATEIMGRQNRIPTATEQECGEVVRWLYSLMKERGWVGSPTRMLLQKYPAISEILPLLTSSYGLKTELFTAYLQHPYQVETTIHRYIVDKMGTPPREAGEISSSMALNPEQMEAVRSALTLPLCIITGGAGTGKTTVIREIVSNLRSRNIPYAVASFTGKAVSLLRKVLGERSPSTLHRLIGMASARGAKEQKETNMNFTHLIIDEASMVTSELIYDLLQALGDSNFALTLVGDANQLPPISWGALFAQLISSRCIPIVRLEQNHRTYKVSGETDGITLNATRLISAPSDMPFSFMCTDNFILLPGGTDSVMAVVRSFRNQGVKVDQLTVVCPYDAPLSELNSCIQETYHASQPAILDSSGRKWAMGDKVMMRENDYNINVMNGEEGIVVALAADSIRVDFGGSGIHSYLLTPAESSRYRQDEEEEEEGKRSTAALCLAYALTVHKAQGSEWDYVLFYLPPGSKATSFLNRNLIYTGLTRAKRALFCIGDDALMASSVARNQLYRHDNLAKRICSSLPCLYSAIPEEEDYPDFDD